jgi:hypothetical protein
MLVSQAKTLDPGLRRDDFWRAYGLRIVIPAQAGIQCLSSKTNHFHHQVELQKKPAGQGF